MRLQRSVESQLRVFKRLFDALGRHGGRLSFVVDHHHLAAAGLVDAVKPPHQRERAQGLLLPAFALFEVQPFGLVPGQPFKIALTHPRPGRLERQKFFFRQTHGSGHLCGGGIDQRAPCHHIGLRRGLELLVEGLQHGMQPEAEVALVELNLQLLRLLQAELTQSEEAVGAVTQIAVGAGRQPLHIQFRRRRHRARHRHRHHFAFHAWVQRLAVAHLQMKRLHQRTGQQGFATVVAGTPEQVDLRRAQRMLPGRAQSGFQHFARRQAERGALGRRPQPGRLGRRIQAHLVTARQHHGTERPAQQLCQRQDHHLLLRRVLGCEAGRLQRLVDPAREVRQRQAALRPQRIGRQCDTRFRQAQRGQHRVAGHVVLQQGPLATALQQLTQDQQPLRQGARPLQAIAQRFKVGQQGRQCRLLAGAQRPRHAAPLAQRLAAQLCFQLAHGRALEGRCVLEPVEHGIAGHVPGTGAQCAHDVGASAAGREFPACLITDLQIARGQHGAHAARQRAVDCYQRYRRAAGVDVLQHASGGALGLVLRIARLVECRDDTSLRQFTIERQHRHALAPHRLQGRRQGVGLKTLQCDQAVGRLNHTRLEQHVAGVRRVGGPGHRQLGHHGLQCQRAGIHAGGRCAACPSAPSGAFGWRHGRGQSTELLRCLQQQWRSRIGLRAQAGALQHGACRQHIQGSIEGDVSGRRGEAAQAAAPVLRGLETRRKTIRMGLRPQACCQGHELGVRQQHHGTCRMRATSAQVGGDTCQPALLGR